MKKMFLKRLLVLCIAGAVVFSTSACNRNYDKDERIEDEDDDDDDSEKLSKKDKDALEQIDDCLSKLYEEDADDTEEFLLVIEDSIQELKTVNKSACSENVRNLVKETEVLLECAKSLQEMVLDISNMVEDMDGIDIAEEALDIDSLVTTEQVNEAYGIILGQAEEIKAVRHSQFFEKILDNYVGIYEAYAAILVEQYYAINNNDYLSIYSNQCLIKELMVEMQELNKDIERMGEESTKHIEAVSERFTGICEEVAYNLKELQRGRNKGLEFTYLEENKKIQMEYEKKIQEADALVIGSPCYWGNMNGYLKVLFDRTVYGLIGEGKYGIPAPKHQGKPAALRRKAGIHGKPEKQPVADRVEG